MKLDDRFMTILTALLVLVGIGALLSRGEDGEGVFTGGNVFDAKPDTFTLRAGRVQTLDVLLNDEGVDLIDPEALRIVEGPACGLAMAVDGAVQYSETDGCDGTYQIRYSVPFEDTAPEAVVSIKVINLEKQHREAIAAAQAQAATGGAAGPTIQTEVSAARAPREESSFAAQRPVRLELPSTAEIITPDQATANIRARIGGAAVTVQSSDVAALTSSGVSVAQGSARAGSVATGGVSLGTPAPQAESSNIQIAAATTTPAAPRRSVAPSGLGAAPDATRPGLPTAPGGGLAAPVERAPAGAALAALPPDDLEPPALQDVPSAPAADSATDPEPTPPAAIAALPNAGAAIQEPAPTPGTAVAPDQPSTATAALPAPSLGGVTVDPVAEPALSSIAPTAQTREPSVASVQPLPEDSGVFASLARSSGLIGATVGAARALFAPTTRGETPEQGVYETRSAPQPTGVLVADVLGDGDFALDQNGGAALNRSVGRPTTPRPTAEAPVLIAALSTPVDIVITTRPAPLPPRAAEEIAPAPPAADAVETTDVAALPADPGVQPLRDQPVAEACGVDLTLTARSGAEIVAALSSPCRPEQAVTVSHAGLTFEAMTSAAGDASIIIPALRSDAEVSVSFPDGAAASGAIAVSGLDMLTRVAILWTADIDFDLHALEFGAREGSEGHIWTGNASTYRGARRTGTGYLIPLGPQDRPGARAEVYTLVHNSRTPGGLVDLSLRLAAFGDACEARPVIRTLRVERGEVQRDSDIQFDLSGCGSAEQVFIPNTLQDVRVDRR